MMRFSTICSTLFAALVINVTSVNAQVIRGIARDSVSGEPVADAVVTLLDSTADARVITHTSARGEFAIKNVGSGFFAVDVRAIGFRPHTSQWMAISAGDTLQLRVSIVRTAPVLSPVVVRAEREAIGERTFLGMKLKTMSARIITPQEVNASLGSSRDYMEIVQASMPPGFTLRTLDVRINKRCIANVRNGKCVAVFVDGLRTNDAQQAIDLATPDLIDHVVILRAIESGTLLGGDSDAGAILVFTKSYAALHAR